MVRHGEIQSNIDKVYAGKSSEHLIERGLRQAREVAGLLRSYRVRALYSSPIQRAVQTAKIISDTIKINVQLEDSFREMELGPWEGLSEDEVAASYLTEWQVWQSKPAELTLPGRETLKELLDRAIKGAEIIHRNEGTGNVVIVTHVAIIRVLLLWHAKKSLNLYKTVNVPNAAVFEITLDTLSGAKNI